MTHQDTNNTIKYGIKQDPFLVSVQFKREAHLNKNIFELNEPEPKNYEKKDNRNDLTDLSMLDPFLMSCTAIKLLLIEKLIAYLSAFSILQSLYMVYIEADQSLNYQLIVLGNAITATLFVLITIGICFNQENMKSRKEQQSWLIIKSLCKILMLVFHPTVWTSDINKYLHLLLLLRMYFPMSYYILSSIYFNPRAARLINIYGIKPQFNFLFACKMILNNMHLSSVIFIYIFIVFFYTHCLFLVGTDQIFIDCFSVVIVTLPTIGYGEYKIQNTSSRIVVLFILVSGVALNAFVTLSMLKKFEMTSRESNSYTLLEKLKMVSEIQTLSTEYIIEKIKKHKFKDIHEDQRLTDQQFKQKYKNCKARYRQLSFHDSSGVFNYFKETLMELKVKSLQSDNMIAVLLTRLISFKKINKQKHKILNCKATDSITSR